MDIALALVAGISIGAVLGFIGAGGAMLTVPILIYLFNFTPVHATTAALLVVFLAAAFGLVPKIKAGDVQIKIALSIWSLGLITNPATILIDEALNDYEVVWAAAGHPHAVYPTTFAELLECTGAKPMVVGD